MANFDFKGKQEYFVRNGAFLLEKQITSSCSSPSSGKKSMVEPLRIFSADDIRTATNNYDDRLVIARSIATVYKGCLDGRTVAIKVPRGLDPTDEVLEFFLNQVSTKLQVTHKNVVKLLGCCLETRVPILVHEYISNGTVFRHLHHVDHISISWRNRLKVATEIAYVLCYMHCGGVASSQPIVHMDVRPLNIFLDENYNAKLTNFGLSLSINPGETETASTTSQVRGSYEYMDPEYILTSKVTEKCDVYGFGAMMVELLTGKVLYKLMEAYDVTLAEFVDSWLKHDDHHFVQMVVDPRIREQGDMNVEETREFAKLALRCVGQTGNGRPSMKEVVEELRRLHQKI